jgi:hypothetical protein
VHGRALVPHVDDAYAELWQMVPDWLNVAALQTEHAVDFAFDEKIGDEPGYGYSCRR